MTLFLQLYVFFFLHILFAIDYLLHNDAALTQEFLGFTISMNYPYDTIDKVIIFNVICFLALLFGMLFGNSIAKKIKLRSVKEPDFKLLSKSITIYLMVFILMGSIGILKSGFNYWGLIEYRESINFIFELRIIGLLLIIYFILLKRKFTNFQRFLLVIYFGILIVFQARSLIMEFVFSVFLAKLFLHRDRLKLKYISWLFILPFIPNIFIIMRQWPMTLDEVVSSLFSFEYTLLFNLLTAEAIHSYEHAWYMGETFSPSLSLLIPSFIRDLLDIQVVKSYIYTDVSNGAGVFGGGFSLLAELFLNFSWFGWVYFIFIGFILGYGRQIILRQLIFENGFISVYQASYFLFYIAALLSLRNDMGVFIKYSIQLIIVAAILNLIYKKERK